MNSESTTADTPIEQVACRKSVLRGGSWVLVGYGLGQVLRIVSNFVLANLLFPKDFGLMALVNVFLAGLQMFSDIGMGPCIVQHERGASRRFLNTAFTLQILRGALLASICWALAGPYANFYERPELLALIPVAGLSILLSGFNGTAIWTLTRQVRQGRVQALRFVSDLAAMIVSIAWALISPSVWALLAAVLVRTLVMSVGSHFLVAEKDRPGWDRQDARAIVGFGGLIFLSTATWFLAAQAERLIFGKFVTIEELGVFSIALMLTNVGGLAVIELNNKVLFPALAKTLRADRSRALRQYGKARIVLAALTGAMAIVMIGGGKWIVETFLKEEYRDAGWMLQILTIQSVYFIAGSTIWSFLMADAKLAYALVANLLRFGMVAIGCYVAIRMADFRTAIWVLGFASLPSYLVYLWGLRKHFPETIYEELLFAAGLGGLLGICFWIAY